MTKDEALKLALEALDKYGFAPCDKEEDWQGFKRAIAAIKEALAQPEQEPVAWRYALDASIDGPRWIYIDKDPQQWLNSPAMVNALIESLYTTPPQRKPLTDVEIWNTYKKLWMFHPAEEPRLAGDVLKFARAIEAKLKERNT